MEGVEEKDKLNGKSHCANDNGGTEGERSRHIMFYLPIFTAVFIIVSLFISYGVSVGHGHVEPDFPYISYTAVEVPERCIFAQLINMGACLMAANVYIRYLQQCQMYKGSHQVRTCRLVIASLVCGLLSSFGLSMVANFQTIVMRPPHYVGAGLAFGFGLTFCWLQTALSLRHSSRDRRVTMAQIAISVLLTSFLIMFAISKAIFKTKERRGEGTREDELRGVYLVSTVSEWLTVVAVVVFALTFCPDFATITFHPPTVHVADGRTHTDANNIELGSNDHDTDVTQRH